MSREASKAEIVERNGINFVVHVYAVLYTHNLQAYVAGTYIYESG